MAKNSLTTSSNVRTGVKSFEDKDGAQSPLLSIEGLSKTYKDGARTTTAIKRIDLTVESGEFVSIVGPSGCGKTTLIKCISGLLSPTTGTVRMHGESISEPPPGLALVFQDYSSSLFPWCTVTRNVELPIRKTERAARVRVVRECLEAVGLTDFGRHYPWQLSGGMQQRVAIARALAYRPEVLVMDEPFASVDAQTRSDLEDLVLDLRARFRMTVVLVTHDVDEAIYMADRVVSLSRPPSTVSDVLEVNLPWPRDQLKTKEMPEFARLRTMVYKQIRSA